MIVCFLGNLLAVSVFFTTFVHKIYVVLKMEKVYAHRESGMEANIIGSATYDLKTTKVSYEDVGQMDMYLKLFDTYKRTEGDTPTIGIILCSETNADVARFSTLASNEQMYAAKYLTYMPSKEVLAREIEQQKEIFRLQHENSNEDRTEHH